MKRGFSFKKFILFPLLDSLAWICENFRRFCFWALMGSNLIYALFWKWPEKGAGMATVGFLFWWIFIHILFGDFRLNFPIYIINNKD